MGFKLSDLKDWTVEREVTVTKEHSVTVTVAIKRRSEFESIVNKGDDLLTAKALIVNIDGIEDTKNKPRSLNQSWDEIAEYPALVMALAQAAVDAQYTAALKN